MNYRSVKIYLESTKLKWMKTNANSRAFANCFLARQTYAENLVFRAFQIFHQRLAKTGKRTKLITWSHGGHNIFVGFEARVVNKLLLLCKLAVGGKTNSYI